MKMVLGSCLLDSQAGQCEPRRRKYFVWKAPDLSLLNIAGAAGCHGGAPDCDTDDLYTVSASVTDTGRRQLFDTDRIRATRRHTTATSTAAAAAAAAAQKCSASADGCSCSDWGCWHCKRTAEWPSAVTSQSWTGGHSAVAVASAVNGGSPDALRRSAAGLTTAVAAASSCNSRSVSDSEYHMSLIVERWLDTHTAFTMDYFKRKATCQMVDAWLLSRAKKQHLPIRSCQPSLSTAPVANCSGASIASSHVRKYSSGVTPCVSGMVSSSRTDVSDAKTLLTPAAVGAELSTAITSKLVSGSSDMPSDNVTSNTGKSDNLSDLTVSKSILSNTSTRVESHQARIQSVSSAKVSAKTQTNQSPAAAECHRWAALVQRVMSLSRCGTNAAHFALFVFDTPIGDKRTEVNQPVKGQVFQLNFASGSFSCSSAVNLTLDQAVFDGGVLDSRQPVTVDAADQSEIPFGNILAAVKVHCPSAILCQTVRNGSAEIVALAQLIFSGQSATITGEQRRQFTAQVECLTHLVTGPVTLPTTTTSAETSTTTTAVSHCQTTLQTLSNIVQLATSDPNSIGRLAREAGLEAAVTAATAAATADGAAGETAANSRLYLIMAQLLDIFNCSECQLLIADHNDSQRIVRKYRVWDQESSDDKLSVGDLHRKPPARPTFLWPNDARRRQMIRRYAVHNVEQSVTALQKDQRRVMLPSASQVSASRSGTTMHISNEGPMWLFSTVVSSKGKVYGYIQLSDRKNGAHFCQDDTNLVKCLAGVMALCLVENSLDHQLLTVTNQREIAAETLQYHTNSSELEATQLQAFCEDTAEIVCINEFNFDEMCYDDKNTLKVCWQMFTTTGCLRRFGIEPRRFCRWLLTVQQRYRRVLYHNWRHAFSVCQSMYSLLQVTGWWNMFGDVESFALLIACLCHDIDHRGTNNTFESRIDSPLAQLYKTSIMERHHFQCCMDILNTQGLDLLANMANDEHTLAVDVIEKSILSTDLNAHLSSRAERFAQLTVTTLTHSDTRQREALRDLLMTASDISAVTKPWAVQYRTAKQVAEEFYEQGDMEKKLFNTTPMDIMDRDKEACLPIKQIEFIDNICMPVFVKLADLAPVLQPLVCSVQHNREQWHQLAIT